MDCIHNCCAPAIQLFAAAATTATPLASTTASRTIPPPPPTTTIISYFKTVSADVAVATTDFCYLQQYSQVYNRFIFALQFKYEHQGWIDIDFTKQG